MPELLEQAPLTVNLIEQDIERENQHLEHEFLLDQLSTHVFPENPEAETLTVNQVSSPISHTHTDGGVSL